MNKEVFVPSVVFSVQDYDNEEAMWKDVNALARILMRCGYEVNIYEDSTGIYVVRYLYNPRSHEDWGSDRFIAVTEDEAEMVYDSRFEPQEEEELPFELSSWTREDDHENER